MSNLRPIPFPLRTPNPSGFVQLERKGFKTRLLIKVGCAEMRDNNRKAEWWVKLQRLCVLAVALRCVFISLGEGSCRAI